METSQQRNAVPQALIFSPKGKTLRATRTKPKKVRVINPLSVIERFMIGRDVKLAFFDNKWKSNLVVPVIRHRELLDIPNLSEMLTAGVEHIQ
jgi:hypothetical protein